MFMSLFVVIWQVDNVLDEIDGIFIQLTYNKCTLAFLYLTQRTKQSYTGILNYQRTLQSGLSLYGLFSAFCLETFYLNRSL